jgi:nucleoside-diphosphate-sugar epimerase
VATLAGIARRRGVAGYVDEGANRWAAVHRADAARLARLAVESAPAGAVLHAVAEEGIAFRDLARALGDGLGVPARSVAAADAAAHFGPVAYFAARDAAAGGAQTRELLGWEPVGPSLLADLKQGHYFRQKSFGTTKIHPLGPRPSGRRP